MNATPRPDQPVPRATNGEIARINLESARRRAWARFVQDPVLPGVAEGIVEMECLSAQFLGDLDALDRLDALACEFARVDRSFRSALIHAGIASLTHCFDEARDYLARAAQLNGPRDAIERQRLAIDQARGQSVDRVLAARRRIAQASGQIEDLVPLGALLADLERYPEADALYQEAFFSYCGASPFPLAWTCFQLGVLWGELVSVPDLQLAALWYGSAIAYLPGYVKARVHLAEIFISQDQTQEATATLLPALSSRDPEILWRFADALSKEGRFGEAETELDAARRGFDGLLRNHFLAFADHAAEFYAGSGNDPHRALELACANAGNRPTPRALKRAAAIATVAARTTAHTSATESHIGNEGLER
jgi:tetratricopeptide (TPR) repeat protein